MAQLFTKDPDAVLDYAFDWSSWLATGETITSYTITEDTGITVDSDSNTDDTVTVWLSGGIANVRYKIVCHIVTSAGRENDRTFVIHVKDE